MVPPPAPIEILAANSLHPAGTAVPPMTLFELMLATKGDLETLKFASNFRLISNSKQCPNCQAPTDMRLNADAQRGDGYRWRCPACNHKQTVRVSLVDPTGGTFFSKAMLPISTQLHFIYLWSLRLEQGLKQFCVVSLRRQSNVIRPVLCTRTVETRWLGQPEVAGDDAVEFSPIGTRTSR
jgi:hypothetical protein